jgi:N-acetylglutamate synthase-like GNAT family acetyltransferase
MAKQTTKRDCVALRSATAADLPAVLDLLGDAGLPTDGLVAEALPDFIVAEGNRQLVGVAGLEVYQESALLRSAAVEESWRGSESAGP